MTLKEQMTDDMSIFYNEDEFGEEIDYTPKGGAQIQVTAIIDRDYPFQEPYLRGPDTATALISVQKSEVSTPQYGDIFGFDSQIWEMDPTNNVVYEDEEEYEIMIVRRD